jgi:hypothetical protein
MVSMSGTIASNFSVSITSSGYTWTPGTAAPAQSAITYVPVALNETFTTSDLMYGLNQFKPGTATGWSLPFYNGQNTSDPSTQMYMMFIDLNVGALGSGYSGLTDNGGVKVQYTLDNFYGNVAFNQYGWDSADVNSGEGISWGNNTASSSYDVVYAGAPVPIPPSILLLAGGLGGLGVIRRRRIKR